MGAGKDVAGNDSGWFEKMRTTWLFKHGRKHLLVFFSGWGIDCNPFKHLDSHIYDVLFVDAYHLTTDRKHEIVENFDSYDQCFFIGWSLGVFMMNRYLAEHGIICDHVYAINGTLRPVHAQYGIDPVWFSRTIDSFCQKNLDKFYRKMCLKPEITDFFLKKGVDRSLSGLKEELQYLFTLTSENKQVECKITNALVSTKDLIIPSKNQTQFWKKVQVKIKTFKGPHHIFTAFSTWDQLVALF